MYAEDNFYSSIKFIKVYAWGDNDHGQQGTGTTNVNKIPTRVLGTEDHLIKRVACGSSHSIAWTETHSVTSILEEVVAFSVNRDPLAANLVQPKDNFDTSAANIAKFMKEQRPSLIRTVLQISSKSLQQEALMKIMQTLEIRLARHILIAYLKDNKKGSNEFRLKSTVSKNEILKEDVCSRIVRDVCENDVTDIVKLLKLGLRGHLDQESSQILEQFVTEVASRNNQVCLHY